MFDALSLLTQRVSGEKTNTSACVAGHLFSLDAVREAKAALSLSMQ